MILKIVGGFVYLFLGLVVVSLLCDICHEDIDETNVLSTVIGVVIFPLLLVYLILVVMIAMADRASRVIYSKIKNFIGGNEE